MSEPYIAEIRCFGFTFAPVGWALCNGQLLSIAENQALFAVIGTTYGGDGVQTFALPNLQGRAPMHWGQSSSGLNTVLGQTQGSSEVTLTTQQIPQHVHSITALSIPQGAAGERTALATTSTYLSESSPPDQAWSNPATAVTSSFSPKAIGQNGSSLPHENMQPYLVMNFCIALEGIFPSQN